MNKMNLVVLVDSEINQYNRMKYNLTRMDSKLYFEQEKLRKFAFMFIGVRKSAEKEK